MVFERKPQTQFNQVNTEVVRITNDNTRRIRILEQSLDSARTRISSLEERMIDEMGDIKKWMDQLSLDIKEISKELKEIRSELLRVNKDLEKTARKTEVKELESLLDLYDPIKSHFITRGEVMRILERELNKV
ncbi:MAG: hypothetical protein COY38_03160 [Candidatus Aenigmarchaeota archaeon CG_4_10_14_0_8_um_filter_37_24]|nr:hypothetical protein [Candidatus Aenigmarchaeota archaeon]OIN87134.1 MAG: hypothetical protein AUJ50_03100 [Candidatus Aenigmarchaeota archaeon CG1_02_38_14]PIV68284.1 MAG: hypothetical protein COS07_04535 [Candidatus Aenigmarchaeota archaeon CG01_land_8_20_14_3_00_37_9]PIW41538.1 MAG: hypothetical protein COW21_01430 [Candidatus Aenigmarchaeota archaeon CG15_BIG_FIL_POST_REV_8_21_14_020_37_27]PIX51083.1 MAG: hypothetical protein COZ52_00780 [Candidatus Aenigmarchaeota archaeon CG_4_8_14_3_u